MKTVTIGKVTIGNGNPIAVQSMTNVATSDADAAINQVNQLAKAGCDIVRLAVPDEAAACAMETILAHTSVPLVADIHFDYRLALMCIERGVHKIRINPGNIGSEERAGAVAKAARQKGIPIRIGVNGGSLEKGLLEKCGGDLARAMVESAKRHIAILNRYDFDDIVLSMKSSDVKTTIAAYRLARETFPYPLHLGVTEAGTLKSGIVKSAIGIGALLADGIGDTIRVSLTDDPVKEAEAGHLILRALDLEENCIQVVSCPTCGRTKIDLIPIAKAVTEAVEQIPAQLKVAVMGCVVNGPGEAKDADIGIAGGDGCAVLFKKGQVIRKIPEDQIVECLLTEIRRMTE
ncbi:flavodoxin-dependent (E)-4-hydroxy-3-methylbut-2-enyl-diphosphate synthase [Ructibacterium gallinarum]|uniref:4-hydroxy-3-methylbut-2-en-1-yl diphosphate synthase (flavodoxin) n=1 Tax=Ructibacterium gallinarum TaxID=2779355 RepID=A0A9D5R882_9FIRM|nr:flavodoxin-dependent (E)-4-hydroxy-3-methylbut-2-enyl-diphosphate synthase [Ructibacterium gallinarum]MBE5039204.1 flavodoxin-dependent (E)-4-hydroxy-3-methylbut-2-enyl-diphosphate synthase [Ructibacterium gallinarum]